MSLQISNTRSPHTGDGSNSNYAYTFKIFSDSDLVAVVFDDSTPAVKYTLALTTDFTVNGVGNDNGGTIDLVDSGQAWLDGGNLRSGWKLVIKRAREILQRTSLRNQGPYFPATVEDSLDKATMVSQDQQESNDRSVKLSDFDEIAGFDPTLPADIATPDVGLYVNLAGNGFATGPTATAIAADVAAAAASAASAAASAAAASTSETNAATSETNAASSAAAALVSETNAATSETNAATSETNAASSAAAALVSETNAAASAATATTQAGIATTQASNAASSAGLAAASAISAADSATAAATSETNAATSETNAATSETNAATSESNAATSEANAAASAAAAAATLASALYRDVKFLTFADSIYSVTQADNGTMLDIDMSGGALLIQLPAMSTLTKPFNVTFRVSDSGGSTCTIVRGGSDLLNGGNSYTVDTDDEIVQMIADPDDTTNWVITDLSPAILSNAGVGAGQLVKPKVGVTVPVKTIKAGANITINNLTDEVEIVGTAAGVTDHGALSGLGDDDHTQYLNETRHDALASDNPHGVTITQAVAADAGTNITPAELETLSDGSNADALHTHSGLGSDADAIHDNVAGEIAVVTEKVTPVAADLILIEDSADSNNKKRVQIGNLPSGGGGGDLNKKLVAGGDWSLSVVAGSPATAFSNTTMNAQFSGGTIGTNFIGQSFQASQTGNLSSIDMHISDEFAGNAGTVWVDVYAAAGSPSMPTGSALGTSNPVDVATGLPEGLSPVVITTFTFPTTIPIVSGNSYAYVLRGSGLSGAIFFRSNNSNPVASPYTNVYGNPGGWSELLANHDLYGVVTVASPDQYNVGFTSDAYLEAKGLNYADNTIPTSESTFDLANDEDVAYVTPNASPGGGNLSVTVDTLDNVTDDKVIIARRIGSEVLIGDTMKVAGGDSKALYEDEGNDPLYGFDHILGSAADVSAGIATHSDFSALITAAANDDTVKVLKSYDATGVGNITLNKRLYIKGEGYGTNITINAQTFTVTVDYVAIEGLRFGDNVSYSGRSGCFADRCWQATGKTLDVGVDNAITIFQE